MAIIKPKRVKIIEVNENPNNPRFIEDEKFEKLVRSIKEFPEMLEIRPIAVTGENNIALGGNQRLKASKVAGLTEVWIIDLTHLSPEKQKEFIIKDNLAYGEWDWSVLTKDFLPSDLKDWGLEKDPAKTKTVNFEVSVDEFSRNYTLKFELSEKEYNFIMDKLTGILPQKEKALLKALGYAE